MTIRSTYDAEPDVLEVIEGLSWDGFEAYLAKRGDELPRVSYLEGTLQLMSPSGNHEIIKRRLAALFDAYLDHVGIQYEGVGAWLLKNADRSAGLEPDECYMLGEIGKSRPDLAIEVIWTSGSIDKLKIYQRLGVPEVWFWKHDVVHVYFLTDTGYERQPSSRLVPGFPFDVFPEVLELQTLSDVRKWLRERFPPK